MKRLYNRFFSILSVSETYFQTNSNSLLLIHVNFSQFLEVNYYILSLLHVPEKPFGEVVSNNKGLKDVLHVILINCPDSPTNRIRPHQNRTFAPWRHFTTKTRTLCVFSFLFTFLFPLGIRKTIGTNYITKENGQSILVVVVHAFFFYKNQ